MSREPVYTEVNGIQITVTQPDDPAYALILDPNVYSTPTVYNPWCYICVDPEFARMGLPLCRPCRCGPDGHVPADDIVCTNCGNSYEYDEYMMTQEEG